MPPFFRALDALTVDDGGARAGFSVGQLPTLDIERVMDAIERAVPSPQVKIVVHRATRRQILRDRSPLATGAQHIHEAIHDFPLIDLAIPSTMFGRWNQRSDVRPFFVRHVTRVTKLVPVVPGTVLWGPHAAPRESVPRIEAWAIRAGQPRSLTDSNDSRTFETDTESSESLNDRGLRG